MTERLYLCDSHLTECTARVTACTPTASGYDLCLDRTVFFPNAGGQPCDTGLLCCNGSAIAVTGCDEMGEELLHHTDAPLEPGTEVTVRLDWARRFDLMQQHTGEHLLSWAANHLFGAVNVGFHLTMDYGTIDLDMPLTHDQVLAIEQLANVSAHRDLPVEAVLYDSEDALTAAGVVLRKHAEGLTAPIRVVTIGDTDVCTCCAPHCYRTGEVGLLFFTEHASYKGGTRLTFLCGERALARLRESYDALDAIARQFSTARSGAVDAVARQAEELSSARKHEKELSARCRSHLAEELKQTAEVIGKWKLIAAEATGFGPGDLRPLAQQALEDNALLLLYAPGQDRVTYLLMTGKRLPLDIGELSGAVNTAIEGKGGGRNGCAQGSCPAAALANGGMEGAINYLRARLKSAK